MSIIKALGLGSIIAATYVFLSANALAFSQPGVVQAGYWDNVSGFIVDKLIVLDAYPDKPDQIIELTELRSPQNRNDNYGSLVKGYIVAPSTGRYSFFVAGDDETQFWLSPSENPATAELTASVTGWTGPDEYTKFESQSSGVLELSAGQRYYFEIRHKEGAGGDHFSVAWEGPGIPQQVIGGSAIASLGQSGSTATPDQQSIEKAYAQGYRVGFLDGSEGLTFNPQYPMLDADRDGLYDNWETLHGLDVGNPGDAGSDPDNDMLMALDEFLLGTRENNSDSDGDGIPDGFEFADGLDPLDPSDASQDMDGDGFSNLEEHLANTDPGNPADAPVTAAAQVSGFIGQYFEGTDFDRFVRTRQDVQIDFSWGSGQPMAELPADNFSVRWSGMFTAPHSAGTEQYQFTTLTDDGVRLYLDGNLVINAWKGQSATPYSHTITLGPRQTIPVTMEYYEASGSTRARLSITRLASGEAVSTRETVTVPDPAEPSGQDTDGDGLPDTWELAHGLNAWADDASSVSNLMDVSNLEAYQSDLDPWTLEPVTTASVPQPTPEPTPNEATLSWTAPLMRMDGSSLSLAEIDHYEIRYGQDRNNLDQGITALGHATSIRIGDLKAGTWYFTIRVIDTNRLHSVFTDLVAHTIE